RETHDGRAAAAEFGIRVGAANVRERFRRAGSLPVLDLRRRVSLLRPRAPFGGWLSGPGARMPFLWVVICGVATAYLVAILGQLIHTPTTKNTMTELMEDRVSLLLMTVFGVTLGPLCEELAFRGFLQPLLVRSLGAVPGIVLAAVPFGLLHYQEYGNSWRHAAIIAAAGAAFGWMRHATGSTKASTLMHASYNTLIFVATLSARKDLIRRGWRADQAVKIAVISRADRLWKSIRGCAGVLSALTRNPGSRFFVSEWAVIRAEHSKWAENIGKRWGTRQ